MFTLGCDPEMLAFKGQHAVPAWELTDGTKKAPKAVPTKPHVGLMEQHDGLALEFNIDPVTINGPEDGLQFVANIGTARKALMTAHGLSNLARTPIIEGKYFANGWEHFAHPLAMEVGCDPDFCAYNDIPTMPRPVPFVPSATGNRYLGGHIHVGYDVKMAPPHVMAKLIDLFVCNGSGDRQKDRRSIYGQPGLYRPKPYGMEYRTLSNYWVGSVSDTLRIVANLSALMCGLENYPGEIRELYINTDWKRKCGIILRERAVDQDHDETALLVYLEQTMPDAHAMMFANTCRALSRQWDRMEFAMQHGERNIEEVEGEGEADPPDFDPPEFDEPDWHDPELEA